MTLIRSLPSLAMLRAFDAFGRAGGIRKAAQMLQVDHAVVSRHLASLEAFVGAALVDRSAGVRGLTSDGAEYHRRVSAAFEEISRATLMLRKRHEQQLLIWCSPGLAYHWLSPRLAALADQDATVGLELRPMDYGPDFAINEADADIRYVRYKDATAMPVECRAADIVAPPVFPVASPSVAASIADRLGQARDLASMRLLHEEGDEEWRTWFQSQGVDLPPSPIPGPRLWHAHMMLDAAKNSQGIALANDFLVRSDLSSGQLVALAPRHAPFAPTSIGFYRFTARANRWNDAPLARFRNWLVREADGYLPG